MRYAYFNINKIYSKNVNKSIDSLCVECSVSANAIYIVYNMRSGCLVFYIKHLPYFFSKPQHIIVNIYNKQKRKQTNQRATGFLLV